MTYAAKIGVMDATALARELREAAAHFKVGAQLDLAWTHEYDHAVECATVDAVTGRYASEMFQLLERAAEALEAGTAR